MSKFTIYSPDGTALYTGTPTFTGQYMKPGMLEFREVSSPRLLDIQPGCYVGYEDNGSVVPLYPRTGFNYKLYTVPQVKKQARPYTHGAAFVYQSVQFFDASKMLEYCPFRDLVDDDNRIHFSTQPSISTFEGCDGLAKRFEACLCNQYDGEDGVQSWRVRIATTQDGASSDLVNLMLEAREFTVSGVNILECLDKIYEIWPEVGWVYTVEEIDEVPTNTIIIGGAGLNANTGTYAYGKGRGLNSITRTVANADEMANRIYAYGDSRNMLPRWYNSLDIKDADSVDIQNLMIPVGYWGTTDVDVDGEPTPKADASKAYVENQASIDRIGLRPKTIYFDGSGEYAAIYPTIRERTIKDVRDVMVSSDQYYPSTTIYTDPNARIDRILSVQTTFDSGLAGDTSGKTSIDSEYEDIGEYESVTFPAGMRSMPVYTYEGTYTPSQSGDFTLSLGLNVSGSVSLSGIKALNILGIVSNTNTETDLIFDAKTIDVTPGENTISIPNLTFDAKKVQLDSSVEYFVGFLFSVEVETSSQTDRTCLVDFSGGYSLSLSNYRSKTFRITLRQLGFDIAAQANLGDGKTIAMRSGACVGRTFTIKSTQYDSTNDAWVLECWRSEDESLSQWFPNETYPVRGKESDYDGDEFVLLDIAMPEIYIEMASQKLYEAALDLLADACVERWQYVPEIDAKYMVENNRTIRSGEYMTILDMDFIEPADGTASYFETSESEYYLTVNEEKIRLDDGSGSVLSALVDSVVINEGEAAIPTYKVTLRDRKKKTWTESKAAEAPSSKSVGSTTNTQAESYSSNTGGGTNYFELDDSGNVTLKAEYNNLWVPGWLSAGGIGQGGGGGGSTVELSNVKNTGTSLATITVDGTQYTIKNAIAWGTPDNTNHKVSVTVDGGTPMTLCLDGYSSGGGGTYTAGYGISISSNTISLKAASENEIGGLRVKVPSSDPSSSDFSPISTTSGRYYYIQRTSGGTAFVNVPWESGGGGGGISSVQLLSGTVNGTLRLKVDGTTGSNVSVYGLGSLAYKSSLSASDIPDLSGTYVTLSTDQSNITGEKTFKKPLHVIASSGTSYIDIGGARLEWDNDATAIRVTKRTGSATVGLYADGFVSAGGVAASSSRNIVFTDGDQDIAGNKSFTDWLQVDSSGSLYVMGDATFVGGVSISGGFEANGVSLSTYRVSNTNYGSVNPASGSRLYILSSSTSAQLVLCPRGGRTYVGAYPSASIDPGILFYINEGSGYAASWETASDRRLKDDITELSYNDAISTIMALKPSVWKWNSGVLKGATASGFIAQDVESIVPYMVKGAEDNKSLNYQMLHAFEVGAIQDHENRLRSLEAKMKEG